ncbi:CCA tRNA nucleotidyltransferase [soil metagenome]
MVSLVGTKGGGMTELPSLAGEAWLAEPALRKVFAALTAAGGMARVAGGAVRNALLHVPVHEIDIATDLTPAQVMAAGEAAGLGVYPTGVDHGTVTLTAGRRSFEVTTLRVDAETFGRKARVAFTSDWEADARRRDFTTNALYCDAEGNILDPVGGYADILRKRVRFVGDALTRIAEDHLRILRFFRFHAHYGAGAPDRKGLAACIARKDDLRDLSPERIRQELLKLLTGKRAVETLRLMAKHGVLAVILPHRDGLRLLARMARIDAAQDLAPDALLRLFLIAAEPEKLRDLLRLANHESERLEAMARAVPISPRLHDEECAIMLYQLGAEAWRDQVRLAWVDSTAPPASAGWGALLDLADGWERPRLPVTGDDLIAYGFVPGPALGAALTFLEDWWVASGFKPSREELLRHLSISG